MRVTTLQGRVTARPGKAVTSNKEGTDMTMDRAIAVLGLNARREFLRPMIKALGLHEWLNTPAEHERRAAARYVLNRWRAYCDECNARRDHRFGGRHA